MKFSIFNFQFSKIRRDFSKISVKDLKNFASAAGSVFLLLFIFVCSEIYFPANFSSHETIIYTVEKGWGDEEIAKDLQKLKIIKSSYFFKFYVAASLKHSRLQAGEYNLSSKMSIYQIAKKMAAGDVIKDKLVILEGWDLQDIGKYLESKGICKKDYFLNLAKKDYSSQFDFLGEPGRKPKDVGFEGYIFPDTYYISKGETCEEIINLTLGNFEKKLTPEIMAEIEKQKKSVFDIITMASLIEKEVRKMSDKKIVSGILWKRLEIGMPLQLDSTVNYVTGKNDPGVSIKDSKVDSPYNTYKYYGLPKGPISSPGIESITAALYPTKTDYLYWLSDGITHFSKTLQEHNAAKAKYLD